MQYIKKFFTIIGLIFRWSWKILATGAAIITTLFFLSTAAMILFVLLQDKNTTIPDGAALVLAPQGTIQEKKSGKDPLTKMIDAMAEVPKQKGLLLQDILDGIRAAANDKRIKILVIAPHLLEQASLNQIQDIGKAIDEFKDSGKKVIAYGDTFSQGQYYLASWADEIYLNPMGSVNLHGLGIFRLYMAELLDKLAINFHVFKVGDFKSALEPFIRNEMSPAAREANRQWLTSLWDRFCSNVAQHRSIQPKAINHAVNMLMYNMETADGDPARMALNSSLIDGLKTRIALRKYLKGIVGSNEDNTSFKQIDFADYLTTVTGKYSQPLTDQDKVAIIIAQGNIVYGKSSAGQIGSASLTKKIRKARLNKHIKALVLRIDSGGGSAFASEMIRQELLLLQEAGKPVVISMGSMAASGGYWIAADADRILASATTLTGSIGIFGALPTFEKSLARAGIFSDGVGTTNMAGAGNPTRALPEDFSNAMQAQVERGYRRFIDIVATGRNMSLADVEQIAEGRVWDGATALELGLVDQLGGLEDAVSVATKLAGLPADQAIYLRKPETTSEILLQSLGSAQAALTGNQSSLTILAEKYLEQLVPANGFLSAGDPQHIYSHCLLPGLLLAF
jgi:protease-4